MSVKISIIVPCYNGENWVGRCIESIIHQSYRDIEILLVNDGSKDRTLEILRKYKIQDPRIKIFTQENKGAGIARNLGIKHSTGDYLTFIDSDDYIEINFIESLVSSINKNTDIVITGIKVVNKVKGKEIIKYNGPKDTIGWYVGLKNCATVCKLYKRDFLIKNKIYYENFKIHEDLLFNVAAFSKAKNIIIQNNHEYICCEYTNPNSLSFSIGKKELDFNTEKTLIDCIFNTINTKRFGLKTVKFFVLKVLIQDVLFSKSGKNIGYIYTSNFEYIETKLGKIRFYWQKGESFLINLIVNFFIFFTKLKIINIILSIKKFFIR